MDAGELFDHTFVKPAALGLSFANQDAPYVITGKFLISASFGKLSCKDGVSCV